MSPGLTSWLDPGLSLWACLVFVGPDSRGRLPPRYYTAFWSGPCLDHLSLSCLLCSGGIPLAPCSGGIPLAPSSPSLREQPRSCRSLAGRILPSSCWHFPYLWGLAFLSSPSRGAGRWRIVLSEKVYVPRKGREQVLSLLNHQPVGWGLMIARLYQHFPSACPILPIWVLCGRPGRSWNSPKHASWRSRPGEAWRPFSFYLANLSSAETLWVWRCQTLFHEPHVMWESLVAVHSSSKLFSNCFGSWFVWYNRDPFTNCNSRKIKNHKRSYLQRMRCQWNDCAALSTPVPLGWWVLPVVNDC